MLIAVALVAIVHPANASTPKQLPDDALLFDSNRTGNYELYRMNVDGTAQQQLTEDPTYDSWWPKISPNRRKVLFQRTPKGVHDTDYAQSTTWVMNLDGSGIREILPYGVYGWTMQGHPEWSPDGRRIATMCGPSSNVQICTVDPDGSDPVMVTSKAGSTQIDPFENEGRRGGTNVDPSWHPDGKSLLFVGCPTFTCEGSGYEIYRINVDGTGEQRLTFNALRDHDAYYSPDGSRIAFLRESVPKALVWSIQMMNPDGSGEHAVIDDGSINSKPNWSVDGDWIYFHRWGLGRTLFNIFKIRPDGTELTELDPRPQFGFGEYDNEFPVNSHF